MGQLLLPLFPHDVRYITPTLGVREENGTVFYLFSGMPIYAHEANDLNMFRYITSKLLILGLCTNQDIADTFHVSSDSVQRSKKKLKEEGELTFFTPEARHGYSHKLLPHVLSRIQGKMDLGQSVNSIAKEEGISEGSIRYAVQHGYLKKNQSRG